MKLLTLNANSYCGETPMQNMAKLIERISESDYDVIALQEVNQEMNANEIPISELDNYIPCQDRIPVKEDNYAFRIVKSLAMSGQEWYWSWIPVHVGWDHFDEGLAILTRHPIRKTNAFYVSHQRNYRSIKTRMALGVQLEFTGRREWFYTVHFDKWHDPEEPFDQQWDRFCHKAGQTPAPIFVMGDFNNDASVRGEAYDYILSSTDLIDTFEKAEYKDNGITVGDYIAGWTDADHPKEMRIDFIFTNTDLPVLSSQIVFNGKNGEPVSDHFGLEVTLGNKQSVFRSEPSSKIPEFSSQATVPAPPSVEVSMGALVEPPHYFHYITGAYGADELTRLVAMINEVTEWFNDLMDTMDD